MPPLSASVLKQAMVVAAQELLEAPTSSDKRKQKVLVKQQKIYGKRMTRVENKYSEKLKKPLKLKLDLKDKLDLELLKSR